MLGTKPCVNITGRENVTVCVYHGEQATSLNTYGTQV